MHKHHKAPQHGFTIVELLIVIVVIAILASISVVAYTGVQNRANDAAIKSDLVNLTKKIEAYRALEGEPPSTATLLGAIEGFKATKGAYGNHLVYAGEHNLLYCTAPGSGDYAIAAWSKSGNGFASIDGAVSSFEYAPARFVITCPHLGITVGTLLPSTYHFWLYTNGAWRPSV